MTKSPGTTRGLLVLLSGKHGIDLTESDLIAFDSFRLKQSGTRTYANSPAIVIAGKGFFGFVGGALGIAAAAFFTGGALALPVASLAFAVGSTVFSLLGSILFRNRTKEENFAPLATLSSGAPLARIGDPAPVVYGRRDRLNPSGGVRVENPILLYSEITSRNGLQQLTLIYLVSKGEIEEISVDPADLLLDDQPISDVLLDSEYQIQYTLGTPTETRVIAPYSCQTIEPTVSNQAGGRLVTRRDAIDTFNGDRIVFESADSLSSLSPADRLVIPGDDEEDPFSLVSRNRASMSATFSRDVRSGNLFAVISATYQSTRKIDRLTVNLQVNLWERDQDGESLEKAAVFDLYATLDGGDRQLVGRFACRGRNPNGSVRGFELRNLGRKRIKIELVPRLDPEGTIYLIGETGPYLGQTMNGFSVFFQQEENLSSSELNTYTSIKKRSQYSFEQGYPLQITSVNEIITDGTKRYSGFSVFKLTIDANERISREPRVSIFVPRGRKVRNLLAAGEATADSTNALNAVTESFLAQVDPVVVGDSVLNLESDTTSTVTAVAAQSLTLSSGTFFQGDRYLVYRVQSSPFLSDAAVDLLSDSEVSSSLKIDPNEALDLKSFVETRRYHYTKKYFWDDTVSERTPFAQWFSDQCAYVLSLPVTLAGQLGVIPERDDEPTALYTVSNMAESDSYQEGWTPLNETPFNRVIVRFRDGTDRLFQELTVTASLNDDEPPNEQIIEARSIKSLPQARALAALSLQSYRHQTKNFSWATDIQGTDSYPGSAALVGSPAIRYNSASSGFVAAVNGSSFKPSLPITGSFVTIEDKDGALPLKQDLIVTVANGWATATGYPDPVIGDRFIAGSVSSDHRKVRISRQTADIQNNKVTLEAVLLPAVLFTEDGLTITEDLPEGTLKWAFEGTVAFQSYEGTFDTQAEALAAAQGRWLYNPATQACTQTPAGGQHVSLASCNTVWAAGYISCPHGAQPTTANQLGLLYKLGSGTSFRNPQDIALSVKVFDGFGETSTAQLTNRLYETNTAGLQVSTNQDPVQYVILDLTKNNTIGHIVAAPATVGVWANGGTVEVFTSLSLPTSVLPDKFTASEGWTSLGSQTFTGDQLKTFTAAADFSLIRLVYSTTAATVSTLKAVDVWGGASTLAKSTYVLPHLSPTIAWVENTTTPGTGTVTVSAAVPATVCGSFASATINLYLDGALVQGPITVAGPLDPSTTVQHVFTGLTDQAYAGTIDLVLDETLREFCVVLHVLLIL